MSVSTEIEHGYWVVRDYDTLQPETLFTRNEFISEIIDSAWESYDWWVGVDYNNLPDKDTQPFLRVAVIDPDGDDGTDIIERLISVKDIYDAYISACSAFREDIGLVDEETLDFDAESGDIIMQFAVLGTHVYS